MTNKKQYELKQCKLESDGNIVCKMTKKEFDNVHKNGVKPNRALLEIEG